MRLVAIFHCWGDWDLLRHAVDNIRPLVDGVIVIGSSKSNYGEVSEIPHDWVNDELYIREPSLAYPSHSETEKRNYGLNVARKLGYTHFLTCDSDEFYDPEQFLSAKEQFKNPNIDGLVVECLVYFRHPWLTIGKDTTLVPFIHKLTPTIRHEFNRKYPFAWEGNAIRIDPTRSLNINSGVEMLDCPLHHMSWVRQDFGRKIRNSTARANLQRSTIVNDLLHAKEGGFCEFYNKPLVRVPNRFMIPDYGELVNEDLFQSIKPVAANHTPKQS